MINPINISTNPMYYNKMSEKQAGHTNTTMSEFELSGYKAGQAILAYNNINFKSNTIITKYTFDAKSLKDKYVANYTNDLIIFLTPPYHSDKSDIVCENSKQDSLNYYNLIFNCANNVDPVKKQQELLKVVYDTDFTAVLEGIKDYDIELTQQSAELNNSEKEERVKVIKSISSSDIRQHMDKFLLNKIPKIEDIKGVTND